MRSTKIRTTLAAVALAVAGAATAPALSAELAGADVQALPPTSTSSGIGPVVVQAVTKSFRAAPQGGANNLLVNYTCDAVAAGDGIRSMITTCQIVTDTGSVFNAPGPIMNGPAASSTGTITLRGNRVVRVCSAANIRYSDGRLGSTPSNCSGVISAAI